MAFPITAFLDPHYSDPGLITEYTSSTWAAAFADSTFKQTIGRLDQQIVKFKLGFEANSQISSSNAYDVPSLGYVVEPMVSPIYSTILNYSIREDDVVSAEYRGYSEAAIQDFLAKKAFFLQLRDAMFFGIKPNSYEGLLNCADRTTANLLASDSYGETNLAAQDNGEVYSALIGHLNALLVTNGLVTGKGFNIGIIAPQTFYAKVIGTPVQLTDLQRQGAGTMSIWEGLQDWANRRGMKIDDAFDEKLIGKGTNGANAVVVFLQEVPTIQANSFNIGQELAAPLDKASISQYFMNPIEYRTPQVDGSTHVHVKARLTPGIAWRGTAVTILSYS